MLPSGIMTLLVANLNLKPTPNSKGLYSIENAYSGRYDFFAPSSLFPSVDPEASSQAPKNG